METQVPSRLRCYMNWQALETMPEFSTDPLQAIRDAGYDGVQMSSHPPSELVEEARALGLEVCGSGRVDAPGDAEALAKEAKLLGLECLTLHAGWGLESNTEAAALIAAVLEASAKYSMPLYPETHRATIFQDPWRTVEFVRRFPYLEFNGDFSHWYTGTDMVYGGFERELEFIRPVLERVSFLHGRIGNRCCMQVAIDNDGPEEPPFVSHFRTLWTEAMSGFLSKKPADGKFRFTAELLGSANYYARTFNGAEESDRWQQSAVLVSIARTCFYAATQSQNGLSAVR